MMLDTLIQHLTRLRALHGDLPVYIMVGVPGYWQPSDVSIEEGNYWRHGEGTQDDPPRLCVRIDAKE